MSKTGTEERRVGEKLRRQSSVWIRTAVAGFGLMAGAVALAGQSTPPPSPQDNPFPGEPAKSQSQSKPTDKSGDKQDKAKPPNDNPFPGEDSNIPIIPVDPVDPARGSANAPTSTPHEAERASDTPDAPRKDNDPEGDPVRSPDPAGTVPDDGFSSSRSGLDHMPMEDIHDATPGNSTKVKTRAQVLKEDLDVGEFYLEKKNWKAAQGRYGAAFALDAENAEAVWGLAEAERHLQLNKEAIEHYKLFLAYDPEGPHGRAARKALDQLEMAQAASGSPARK